MTASNTRVSQVSRLIFERASLYTRSSKEGYVVAAIKVGDGWLFEAHGPKRATVFHRDGRITTGDKLHQVSYAIGEETPAQRDHLGVFRPADHGGTDAAREAAIEACQQHHLATGPSQTSALRTLMTAGFG